MHTAVDTYRYTHLLSTHIDVYTHNYTYTCTLLRIHTYTQRCMYTQIHTDFLYTHMHACVYIHTYMYAHMPVHPYIHRHTHTDILGCQKSHDVFLSRKNTEKRHLTFLTTQCTRMYTHRLYIHTYTHYTCTHKYTHTRT